MKKTVTMILLAMLATLFLAGCGMYKQYTIGARATIDGRKAQLNAELWECVNSGLFAPAIQWSVDWGDGAISDEKDAISPRGSNWICTEPLRFLQWTHTYAQVGNYDIIIKATNADPVILQTHIE